MSYIYVMQNDGLPGLVQIGMTDDNPEVRAQELSNITGALGRLTVAGHWQLKDAAIYEQRIYAVLGCYRVSGEHFRLPVEGAIRRITALLYSWGVVNEEGLTREEAEAVREAAALRAEQDRVEAVKRADEARQRTIEAEVARAQAEAARRSFIDRVQSAIPAQTRLRPRQARAPGGRIQGRNRRADSGDRLPDHKRGQRRGRRHDAALGHECRLPGNRLRHAGAAPRQQEACVRRRLECVLLFQYLQRLLHAGDELPAARQRRESHVRLAVQPAARRAA
jgi:hypothetical protein